MTSSSEEMEGFETWVLWTQNKDEDHTGSLFISDYWSSSSYKMLSEFPESTYDLTLKAQNQVLFIFSLLVLYQFLILTLNVQW